MLWGFALLLFCGTLWLWANYLPLFILQIIIFSELHTGAYLHTPSNPPLPKKSWLNNHTSTLIIGKNRGGFRVLVCGVRDGERSEPKIFGNLLSIFTGGCQPLIYIHINRGQTYDLLIVTYHLLKI